MSVNGVSGAVSTEIMFSNRAKKSNSDLGVEDFLKLIVAQMQNQDMMNPMNDNEFFSQMAQFSTLQAIQDLGTLSNTNYSVSLLGKEVTAAKMVNNKLQVETGIVTGVGLYDGEPSITIGEKRFKLNEIMVVGSMTEDEAKAAGTDKLSEPEKPSEPEQSAGDPEE